MVFGLEKGKNGKYCYMVGFDIYDGVFVEIVGIIVVVLVYCFLFEVFIGILSDFNFIGKKVEFILLKKYELKYMDKKYIENILLVLWGKILEQCFVLCCFK